MFNIAIWDDEKALISELKDNLKKYASETGKEFCFFVYHDGSELLQEYRSDYDLIFMDIKMEKLNGLKTAEEIRKMDSMICPLSSRQVKYLKFSAGDTCISIWDAGIFLYEKNTARLRKIRLLV